jgi:pimeloyl-ACP methyl ester carboxylesterase
MGRCTSWLLTLAVLLVATVAAARAQPSDREPVKAVADQRLTVSTSAGQGSLPVYVSADWSAPLPAVNRVVIVVHGTLRNADVYFHSAERARDAAGVSDRTTLLIVPQFLTEADINAHHLPPATLRWSSDGWKAGDPAEGPVPLSSFDAFDAVLARLADTSRFPALRSVIVAGHSAGAQVVQRYAVVGRGEAALTAHGIRVRYVVANPSSYLWFGEARPRPVNPAACPDFDRWKYGLGDAPPYVGDTSNLEDRFINRDVVYLLGELDTNRAHPFLDRSCAAEAQGETRFARGMLNLLFLEQRHPNLVRHRIFAVPGVGHNAARMFGSACGLAALFDQPGCVGF